MNITEDHFDDELLPGPKKKNYTGKAYDPYSYDTGAINHLDAGQITKEG